MSFFPLRSCRCDLLGSLPSRWQAKERKGNEMMHMKKEKDSKKKC